MTDRDNRIASAEPRSAGHCGGCRNNLNSVAVQKGAEGGKREKAGETADAQHLWITRSHSVTPFKQGNTLIAVCSVISNWDRTAGLVLDDCHPTSHVTAYGDVIDTKANEIATAKLAVDARG